MTEERKQELKQLLNEAMASLVIRPQRSGLPSMDVQEYRNYLQRRWKFYPEDSISVLIRYKPDIVNDTTKSKLLDFIRAEFAPFIHEDRILSASCFLLHGSNGFNVDYLLEQLLRIAIVWEIEGGVSAFDRCTQKTYASFQYMALLVGIELKTEIQVCEGIRLVSLPGSTSELPRYLPNPRVTDMSAHSLRGKTMLIIDCSVSPIFQKPFREDGLPFEVKVNGRKFSHVKADNFYKPFCQALSLACNSPVQIALKWEFWAADELFNVTNGVHKMTQYHDTDLLGSSTEAGEAQIDEAKRLYHILINLNSRVREKLRIPIDRWIMSKTNKNYVDKMIDLGIAFESVYLSDINPKTELSFRFRLHAFWHLGTDKEHRQVLMKEFRAIYDCRSDAVHKGKLDQTVKFGEEHIPISEFIQRAQDLCWESIVKILEAGEFPEWNDLILG